MNIYLLVPLGCTGSSLLCGLSSSCRMQATCGGFSCFGGRLWGPRGAVTAACGRSSGDAWASLLCGTWDLSSPIRDWTHVPCIGRWILNLWTTRLWSTCDGLQISVLLQQISLGNNLCECVFLCVLMNSGDLPEGAEFPKPVFQGPGGSTSGRDHRLAHPEDILCFLKTRWEHSRHQQKKAAGSGGQRPLLLSYVWPALPKERRGRGMPEDPKVQSKATRAGLGVVGIPFRFSERAQTHTRSFLTFSSFCLLLWKPLWAPRWQRLWAVSPSDAPTAPACPPHPHVDKCGPRLRRGLG